MQNSEYLHRLSVLYRYLNEESCDINNLISKITKSGFTVSKRQIYLDINNIKQYLLREDEQLTETLVGKQKKIWRIINTTQNKDLPLNNNDIYKLLIIKDTLPLLVNECNIQSVIHQLTSHTDENSLYYRNEISNGVIIDSNFFQKKSNESNFEIIIDFYNAIIENKKIKIIRKVLDATCVNTKISQFSMVPISLIYHNGSMFISGLTQTNRIIIFDVSQIVEYSISTKRFKRNNDFIELLKQELSNRFGVSENIDDNVYDIEIEFSTLTGEYLKLFNIHPTQKFRYTNNGYILSLKCGINRELVSWIFNWMDNARIIKPEKLKNIYIKQVNNIIRLNSTDSKLNYSNIFIRD